MKRSLKFYHGLGDVCNFARMIPIYKKHGIDIEIECSADKAFPFQCSGATIIPQANESHRWWIPSQSIVTNRGNTCGWMGNKSGENLKHYGLNEDNKNPTMDLLWDEYKKIRVGCKDKIEQQHFDIIEHHIRDWQRPIILWHSIGNTNQNSKSFNKQAQDTFLSELIDKTNGTILLLDWDNRVSWTHNHRIKHLTQELGNIDLQRLAALMYSSNLMIGIDSGPYYFSSFTNIPSAVVFFDGMHPCEYIVPDGKTLAFSCGGKAVRFDPNKRFEFQIINYDREMNRLANWVSRMLQPRKYFRDNIPIASDVHLQQIVEEKCRGTGGSGSISAIYDRNRSFDVLLKECKKRFIKPIFVETGCIRADEDWGGAGFSTALFGRYCQLTGGKLTSIDLSESNCNYARQWCTQFGDSVNIQCSTGEEGLKKFPNSIDVLYLDSLDTDAVGHQECNLNEFKAAEEKLSKLAIVIIDDTPTMTLGKGTLTVKYMLEKGWKILYAGYQVVLSKAII